VKKFTGKICACGGGLLVAPVNAPYSFLEMVLSDGNIVEKGTILWSDDVDMGSAIDVKIVIC